MHERKPSMFQNPQNSTLTYAPDADSVHSPECMDRFEHGGISTKHLYQKTVIDGSAYLSWYPFI